MDKEIKKILRRIILFVLVLFSGSLMAEEEKFNLGGNEPVDSGPMFIVTIAASVFVFGLLLFLKIRNDKKKNLEIKEQLKMQAKNMTATTRSRSQVRTAASRSRGATS
jgi:hypothetical protein